MAPSRKAGGRKRSRGGETTEGRRLTPDDAQRLAEQLGFSEPACDVLSRWTKARPTSSTLWLLTNADAKCLGEEVGISGIALDTFCIWLRIEMLNYDLSEGRRHRPSAMEVLDGLPQFAEQLRQAELILREHYLFPMIFHEIEALANGSTLEDTKAAEQRVVDEVRAFSVIVERMEAMARVAKPGAKRHRFRSRKRGHDHHLAESALAFWDYWLRGEGVLRDPFCRLVLALHGIKLGSIETFVRDARRALLANSQRQEELRRYVLAAVRSR